MATTISAQQGKTILGHPRGLFVLFFTEMWERMSYYGMRALLVLYMTKYLLADPEKAAQVFGFEILRNILGFTAADIQPFASEIYGIYTGLVYLSPFFGGILADRVWGKRKSVYIGGALMAIGHFLMAFESLFLPALFFIIMGNGAFKPNISTQVGNLYPEGDPRRDGAFTIFYMGVNIGAFFSPFLCKEFATWLTPRLGITVPGADWHVGFALAGIGMLIGLVIYHLGRHLIPHDVKETESLVVPEKRTAATLKTAGAFFGCVIGFILFLMLHIAIKIIILIAIGVGVVYAVNKIKDQLDRSKVFALITLCLATVVFWAIFEQQGNTLQLWADEKADFAFFGLQSTTYQSFNPFFIFAFAPLLNMIWARRAKQGKTISSIRKMAIGCFLAGSAFLVLAVASQIMTIDKSVSNLLWLALTTWIFTMGELYLSPIGLSFVTKIAPTYIMSMMMGMWFLSSFAGNYLAGYLGGFYSKMSNNQFFMLFAIMGAVVGLFFLFAEKKIQKAIGRTDI